MWPFGSFDCPASVSCIPFPPLRAAAAPCTGGALLLARSLCHLRTRGYLPAPHASPQSPPARSLAFPTTRPSLEPSSPPPPLPPAARGGIVSSSSSFRTDVISAIAAIVTMNIVIVAYVMSALGEDTSAAMRSEKKD